MIHTVIWKVSRVNRMMHTYNRLEELQKEYVLP